MPNHLEKIYLDHSATTPVDPAVIEAMRPYFGHTYGNASSIHAFGRESKIALEESREKIAALVGARPGEIFFTSGGTEADNHALFGVAFAAKRALGNNHVVVSAIEHHAVLHTAEYLSANGFELTIVPVDQTGMVSPDDVRASIRPTTSIISVMHANNEIGTIQPIKEIARVAHENGIVFHSDTVQSAGKIPIDVEQFSVDVLAISAHKFYGPKGIGAIYIRRGIEIDSLIQGGAQERNRRAGTENVPLAVGFGRAAQICREEFPEQTRKLKSLKEQLARALSEKFDCIIFNGHPTESLPSIVNVSFDSTKIDIDGEALLLNMDLHGIAVTSGSACSSGSMEPSHVLHAIGRDLKTARASIRFSMGKNTTHGEIEKAVNVLENVVKKISTVTA